MARQTRRAHVAVAGPQKKQKRKPFRRTSRTRQLPKNQAHKRFSAHHNKRPVPVPQAIGEFTFTPTMVRDSITVQAAASTTQLNRQYMLLFWSKSGIRAFNYAENGLVDKVFDLTMLVSSNPLTVRPNALSVSLINRGQSDTVSGVVRVLQVNQGLDIAFDEAATSLTLTNQTVLDIAGMLHQSPATRTFSAEYMRTTRVFCAPPATHDGISEYAGFQDYNTKAIRETKLTTDLKFNKLNVVAFEFSAGNASQTYEIVVKSNDCARYAQNTLYAQMTQMPQMTEQNAFINMMSAAQHAAAEPVSPH
jgi:hypothetical protein